MVNGPSPGPPPAAQARDSSSRLTRSSWRTWPHRKLRRKVPRVEGAFTVPPRTPAVPPARNASASSMQSPPASAEATSVIILSPVLARPGARPRCWASVAGRISPALATRRWSSKAIWMRSGCSSGSIYWVLPVSGWFPVPKPLSQIHRSTFLPLNHAATLISSVDSGLVMLLWGGWSLKALVSSPGMASAKWAEVAELSGKEL